MAASSHDFNVIVIVETWLTSHFMSNELFDKSYDVYRRDRILTSNITRGGGVLLAVESKFASREITLPNICENVEQICVAVTLSNMPSAIKEFVFIVSYIPPLSGYELYKLHLSNIEYILSSLDDYQLPCVLGDFNLGSIVWELCEDEQILMPFNITNNIETYCCDKLYSLGLTQVNDIRNDINRILDLIFVGGCDKCMVQRCNLPLTAESVHHKALEIIFSFYDSNADDIADEYYYDFKSADYGAVNSFFNSICWGQAFYGLDLKNMYEVFKGIISECLHRHIPVKKKRKQYNLPWYNQRLLNLKNRRNKANKVYKNSGLPSDRDNFKRLRREFDFLSNFLYKRYIAEMESHITNNPKSFWLFFNAKKTSNGIPKSMIHGQLSANEEQDVANLFAMYFLSIYEDSTTPL